LEHWTHDGSGHELFSIRNSSSFLNLIGTSGLMAR
jgi:hypothetical protein